MERKAYKIRTKIDEYEDDFIIISAETAGRAKTIVMSGLHDAYPKETYACIVSCRRCYEYDNLAQKYKGHLAWKQGSERWEQDKGHWFE